MLNLITPLAGKLFRKPWARMGLLLWLFLGQGALVYAEDQLTADERAYLRDKGAIVFVSQSHYAPFEFIQDDGTRDGMCIELARWIATEFGFKAVFVDTNFSAAQQMIQSGEADVLTSFFYSEKRDRLFDFSQVMYSIPATIFVAADRPDIKDISDLNGKTIAIQKGDYAEEFLREKQINFKLRYAANFAEASDMVVTGKADAVIGDEQIVLYYLYSNNLEKNLKKVGQPLYSGENSMAVVEGQSQLVGILNQGISLATERGVLKSISAKWLGTQLIRSESRFYQYRWFIIIVSLSLVGLLIFIWFWNLSLRREVRRRTRTLEENEHFLDTVIEHIPNMVFVKDAADLTFLKFNRAGEELTGLWREDLYGKNDYDLFPQQQADWFTQHDRAVIESGQLVNIPEEVIETRCQGKRTLHTQKICIPDGTGRARYLLGISEDITDRLALEQARRISDERLRAAIDALDEGFVIYDADDRLVMCNQKYKEFYPSIAELSVPGTRFEDLVRIYSRHLFDDPTAQDEWRTRRLEEHRRAADAEIRTVEGRWIKFAERKTSDGSTVGIRFDITRIRESEQHLIDALKEKETLLKEVHHRVKNNMQVISSLLSLQMQNIKDAEIREVFNEARHRIHAMALVHETLYKSKSFADISVTDYFRHLTTQLSQLMGNYRTSINYEFQLDDMILSAEEAVPFGLIVTEILTNTIKYAFPERSNGTVTIALIRQDNGSKQLTISDDGIGLAAGINPQSTETLGLRLIRDLTEGQLEGNWTIDGNNGVTWTISW